MIANWFIVGSVLFSSIFIILALSMLRKHKFHLRFLKVSVFVAILFFVANPVPQYWGTQFRIRWADNRTQLIEPNHPIMPSLNQSFQSWYYESNGINFSSDPDFEHRVRAVDEYVRTNRFRYTLDQAQYVSYDHLATIDDVIASEDVDGYWHDDCDGISVITASFLIFLGFRNTYISEVTYHYHTMVYQEGVNPKTKEGYLQGIALYRGRVLNVSEGLSDHVSYYMWNQTEMFVPEGRPLWRSIGEIFTDGNVWRFDVLEIYDGTITGMPLLFNLLLMWVVGVLAGTLCVWFPQIGLKTHLNSERKKHDGKKHALILGTVIFGAFTVNFVLAYLSINNLVELAYLCNPIVASAFLACFRISDRRFVSEAN